MVTFLDSIVVVAVAWYAYKGWNVGVLDTTLSALELVACLTLAVLLHETVAGYIHGVVSGIFGDSISQSWALLIAFSGLAWGPFVFVQKRFHDDGADQGDEPDMDPLADRIGGVVAGGIGGAIFVGGVLMTISMVPFLASMKPSGDRMLFDVGKLMLRTAGQFVLDRHEGVPLPIWGEPASTKKNTKALLTSEPWFDLDEDSVYSEADRYRDVDGETTFSKELYYVDVDGDRQRRIGLVDKYVVGRWDLDLKSTEQKRTDLKKDPPKPRKGGPDPAQPTGPEDDF
jgi:hypothetical protein